MLKLVKVCVCGSVATTAVHANRKTLDVCYECASKATVKLLTMSMMVNEGTAIDVADMWSR